MSSLDYEQLIREIANLETLDNERGIISAFGLYLQQLPTDFWNGFTRRVMNELPQNLIPVMEDLLVAAAQECGYYSGHGILNSREWQNLAGARLEAGGESELRALFAVFGAWGWAKIEVIELIPGQFMRLRAYDYYESDVVAYGRSERGCAYTVRGVCAGYMDLFYGPPYPDGLGTFACRQIKGVELGDAFGEFEVYLPAPEERRPRENGSEILTELLF